MLHRTILAVALACHLAAAADVHRQADKKWWWLSVAALGAATAADVRTSWGRPELNPMLSGPDGRFGARGVAVKLSISGVNCGLQWLLLRKRPDLGRAAAGVNASLAAWNVGVVARNQ